MNHSDDLERISERFRKRWKDLSQILSYWNIFRFKSFSTITNSIQNYKYMCYACVFIQSFEVYYFWTKKMKDKKSVSYQEN